MLISQPSTKSNRGFDKGYCEDGIWSQAMPIDAFLCACHVQIMNGWFGAMW